MQPYQEATEEIRRQGELPLNIAKNLGSVAGAAATAYLGGGAINRVLPFLSKYIPEDLAIKGLSKLDPRYGSFIKKALGAGKSFEEVKEFIGSKIEEGQEEKKPKENRNVIQQYSPELHQFLDQEIKKGRAPIEAGAIAQHDKRFKDIISKLSKEHKTPWSNILEAVYGAQGQAKQSAQQPQQQSGQGQAALMEILQKIQQARGGQ
jgi:hypothetical protein